LAAEIDFRVEPPRPQVPVRGAQLRASASPDGVRWSDIHRTATGYLVRFPGLADFEVSADGSSVRSWPAAEEAAAQVRGLYLNHVQPLALSRRGHLVVHAGAVEHETGAIAFVGASGAGKSTLVASFARTGFPFLADDGLLVERRGESLVAVPLEPSLRLWEDSQAALTGAVPTAPQGWMVKRRLPGDDGLPHCAEPRALACLFFLGSAPAPAVSIAALRPAEALIELVRNSFLLELERRESLGAHFEGLASLVARLRCYRLDYARRYDALAAVREAVLRVATAGMP
jgi:hypothetical protein